MTKHDLPATIKVITKERWNKKDERTDHEIPDICG